MLLARPGANYSCRHQVDGARGFGDQFRTAKAGDTFDATLAHPLVVNGKTLADRRAGKRQSDLREIQRTAAAPGELTLRLTSVEIHGKRSRSQPLLIRHGQGPHQGQCYENWRRCGGRGLMWRWRRRRKGAAIGAAVGAGAGTGVAAATGKEEAVVPAETALTFTTRGSNGEVELREALALRRPMVAESLSADAGPAARAERETDSYAAPFTALFKYASTSSAWPSGFTLWKMCLILPSGPMMNVVRTTPMTFFPYMFFSWITP